MCPSCLTGGIGPGYIAAFVICLLFFVLAAGAMFWASKSGRLEGTEQIKFKILEDVE